MSIDPTSDRMCGRVIQSSAPIRLAIVDGLDVRDSRVHNSVSLERCAEPRAAGDPAQPPDRRGVARPVAMGAYSLLLRGP